MSRVTSEPDHRMSASAATRTAPAREFDRWDALILAVATMAGILGGQAAIALEPISPEPMIPSVVASMVPSLPVPVASTQPGTLVPSLPIALPPAPAAVATDVRMLVAGGAEQGILHHLLDISRPFLMAWTLAIPVLRLRTPRPPRRALFRQPGMAACGIASLVLIVQLSAIILRCAVEWTSAATDAWLSSRAWSLGGATASALGDLWLSTHSGFLVSASAGHGIAGAWLIMALGGWWRPERSGIDRLGRALGGAWIGVLVLRLVESWRVYFQ